MEQILVENYGLLINLLVTVHTQLIQCVFRNIFHGGILFIQCVFRNIFDGGILFIQCVLNELWCKKQHAII